MIFFFPKRLGDFVCPKRFPSSQVPNVPSSQVPKFPSSQVPKFPCSQVPKSPSPQVPKFPSYQVTKLPSYQVPGLVRSGLVWSGLVRPETCLFLSVQLDVSNWVSRLLGWHQDHGLPEGIGHGKNGSLPLKSCLICNKSKMS